MRNLNIKFISITIAVLISITAGAQSPLKNSDGLANKSKFDGIFKQMLLSLNSVSTPAKKIRDFHALYELYIKEVDRYADVAVFDKSVLDSTDLSYAWALNRKIIPFDGLETEVINKVEKFSTQSCLQSARLVRPEKETGSQDLALVDKEVYKTLVRLCPVLEN